MKRLTEERLTDGGRVLNTIEARLADYLGDERQAVALAPHVYLPTGLTPEEQEQHIEQAVIGVLCDALEAVHGVATLQYCGGQRRDTLREAAQMETTSRLLN